MISKSGFGENALMLKDVHLAGFPLTYLARRQRNFRQRKLEKTIRTSNFCT